MITTKLAKPKHGMTVQSFFRKLEQRIDLENQLAAAPGIRRTAREAAARRASEFLDDLTYLKHRYDTSTGQGDAK